MSAKQNPDFGVTGGNGLEVDTAEEQVEFAEKNSQPAGASEGRAGRAVLTILSTVQMRPVQWVWRGYIPLGKMTVLDGNPGVGKSTITLDIAARITVGATMPDGTASCLNGPRGVVLMSAEDAPDHTIRPRLEAAGGDPDGVVLLTGVTTEEGERMPCIEDLGAIEHAVCVADAAMIVIDPLFAYIGSNDAHRDSQMRAALAPLLGLCERFNVALVVLRHLNKGGNVGGGTAMYRGGGTIGIIGAARCAFVASRDPGDGSRCILAPVKTNLTDAPPAHAYHLEARNVVVPGAQGLAVPTSRVVWGGEVDITADALVAPAENAGSSSQLDAAKAFLAEELASGPVASSVVDKDAKALGIAPRTLKRARTALSVQAYRVDATRQTPWMMRLPGSSVDGGGSVEIPQGEAEGQAPGGQGLPFEVGPLADVQQDHGDERFSQVQGASTTPLGPLPLSFDDPRAAEVIGRLLNAPPGEYFEGDGDRDDDGFEDEGSG